MPQRKRADIVSMHLSDDAKAQLDEVCQSRGMTIKTLLGQLVVWFNSLDKTEQSIVLGQVENDDIRGLAEMVLSRQGGNRPKKSGGSGKTSPP